MAIEIRIESSWETDDGEGRKVEVSLLERERPSDDPIEHSRFFASGDVESLKRYVSELIERHQRAFATPRKRECVRCQRVCSSETTGMDFVCAACGPLA